MLRTDKPFQPPGLGCARRAVTATTAITSADHGIVVDATSGTYDVTATSAATLGSGFSFGLYNSGSGTVTFNPAGAETVRSPSGAAATLALLQGQGVFLVSDGTNWDVVTDTGLPVAPSTPVVVRDNAFTITDEADTSKTLVFSLGAMATGVDLIINAGAQTIDATLSLPVLLGNDTLVSLATVQTLSGAKTFNAALVAGSTLAVTGEATLSGGALVPAGQAYKVNGVGGAIILQNTGRPEAITVLQGSANTTHLTIYSPDTSYTGFATAARFVMGSFVEQNSSYVLQVNGGVYTNAASLFNAGVTCATTLAVTGAAYLGTIGSTFAGNVIAGVQDGTAASAGQVGEVISAVVSTATNAAATGTYLALASITLEGDWLISGWVESIPNGATLTVDGATELVIGTTTASAAGSVVGDDRVTENHPIIAGVRHQIVIAHKRVNPSTATTYYLNVLATFTVGTPQWVGTIRATRQR